MSNTSMAAPAIRLFFNTLIKACSSTIGPRDALINRAVGFILSSSAAPTRPRVRLLNTKWIVRMSARSNNWSLETRIATAALAASGVIFWLQAIRFIPNTLPTRATSDPTRPSPRTPRLSAEIRTHCLLPAAGSDGVALRHDVSRGGQDQRPGKFDRRVRPMPCVNHSDVMIARGDDINRRVYRSSRGNELEIRKALNDVAGQRGTLAQDTNDVKRQQPLNHGVRIGEVVLKCRDVRSITEQRPISALKRHILVIVQNSNLVLLHWHPSRSDWFGPSPPASQARSTKSSVCLSGSNVSLRAPFEGQEEVGGWESFLHGINRLSRFFAFFSSSSKTYKLIFVKSTAVIRSRGGPNLAVPRINNRSLKSSD